MLSPLAFIHSAVVAQIAILDLTLSANNAAVAAPACAALPSPMRRRAMLLGGAAAIALRAALLVVLSYVIGLPYIRAFGGAYLCFAGFQLLTPPRTVHSNATKSSSIGSVVKSIALGDMVMSIDNALAISAVTSKLTHYGTAYGVAGVCLSIPVVMFGSSLVATAIERFPIVTWVGGGLLGWVGVELALSDPRLAPFRLVLDFSVAGKQVPAAEMFGFCAVALVGRISNLRAARSGAINLN